VFSISSLGQIKPERVVVCVGFSVGVDVVAEFLVDADGCEVVDDVKGLGVVIFRHVDCDGQLHIF
jgi:hypothetical protein